MTEVERLRSLRHPSAKLLQNLETVKGRMPTFIKKTFQEQPRQSILTQSAVNSNGWRISGSSTQLIQQAEAFINELSPKTPKSMQD
jgi:hypothetical protein